MNRVTTTLYTAIGVLIGLVVGLAVFFALAELPQHLGGTALSFNVLAPVSYAGIPLLIILFAILMGIKGNRKAHAQAALWDDEEENGEEDEKDVNVTSTEPIEPETQA